jgi:hypothetical protein
MNRQKELDEYHTNDEYHEWHDQNSSMDLSLVKNIELEACQNLESGEHIICGIPTSLDI